MGVRIGVYSSHEELVLHMSWWESLGFWNWKNWKTWISWVRQECPWQEEYDKETWAQLRDVGSCHKIPWPGRGRTQQGKVLCSSAIILFMSWGQWLRNSGPHQNWYQSVMRALDEGASKVEVAMLSLFLVLFIRGSGYSGKYWCVLLCWELGLEGLSWSLPHPLESRFLACLYHSLHQVGAYDSGSLGYGL